MKKLKYVKFFENFMDTNLENKRSDKEILSSDNFEDLLAKMTKISSDNRYFDLNEYIQTLQGWMEEVTGSSLYGGEGESNVKITDELIEEVIIKIKEIKRFTSTGKYQDRVIDDTIVNILSILGSN